MGFKRGDVAVTAGAAPTLSRGGARAGQQADAEQRFRALLEAAPDAMVIVDQAGTIKLVNAQTEAVFGYPREELLGRPVEILVPRRFRADHPAHRTGYAANRQVRPMGAGLDLYGVRQDGSEFPVEISLSPLATSDGLLVSAAVRDVSDRKAAEERINEFELIVESSQDAILTKTLDGVITFWNAAAARMYGYTAQEAVGRHVSMLAPPGHEDEIGALLARIGRGERVDHYETLRMTRTGSMLDVDILLCPVRTRDGAIVGGCAIARDIAEHKRAQQEITRLYQQQRHVALTLQRALMGSPPEVPGMDTASRYLPATGGAGVGGDWFDLIPLGAGRVGVLIGDVMGRGLEAATVMGQLRSAANALARTGMPPQQLMHALDAVARGLPDQLITCCYLVINAAQGEVTATSAGHLPVLLVQPDATVSQLPIPVSVPLGVGGIPHQETTLPVPHRSTLVLYTDGLVETRVCDLGTQINALESQLRTVFAQTSSLEQAADRVLATLLPSSGEPADDVTLLLARTPAAPLASAQMTLRPEPQQVAVARRFTRDTLTAWQHTELADTACLLVSETLTNAVRHARQTIGVHLHYTDREIIAEITDDNTQLPQRTLPAPADESGRGLTLVEALASTWGTRPSSTGKTVWFTLTTHATPIARPTSANRLGFTRSGSRPGARPDHAATQLVLGSWWREVATKQAIRARTQDVQPRQGPHYALPLPGSHRHPLTLAHHGVSPTPRTPVTGLVESPLRRGARRVREAARGNGLVERPVPRPESTSPPEPAAHDAVAEVRYFASRSYEWVAEGDIKACFDEISHNALQERVRARIADKRVLALVKAFLKAGILTEDGTLEDTSAGTPQGGLCAAAHKPPYEQCRVMRSAGLLALVGARSASGRCA